ncbi:hypothetical protein [Brevibacillus laterosporus]|uniref:hypothetical protein n=1 Tax=Brevibacillus laterosporus TaxID=1465 RepID=UPI00265CB56F|nr:hypothetical protein [Brevibacillus laterosporus]
MGCTTGEVGLCLGILGIGCMGLAGILGYSFFGAGLDGIIPLGGYFSLAGIYMLLLSIRLTPSFHDYKTYSMV